MASSQIKALMVLGKIQYRIAVLRNTRSGSSKHLEVLPLEILTFLNAHQKKKKKKKILSPKFPSLEKPQWPDFQGFISFSLVLYSIRQMSNPKYLATR